MYLPTLLPLLWAGLSSAKTFCTDSTVVPALDSCDRALRGLEDFITQCRPRPGGRVYIGPDATDQGDIHLPIAFVDPTFVHGTSTCGIIIVWKPQRRPPPPTRFDYFMPLKLQQAAYRIRDLCLSARQGGKLGYEPVGPLQCVEVQLGVVYGNEGNSSDFTGEDTNITVSTMDGTNLTVESSMVNPVGCAGAIGLQSALRNSTKVVEAM